MQDGASAPLPGAVGTEHLPKHPPFPLPVLHQLQPRAVALQGPTLHLQPGLCTLFCGPGSSKGLAAHTG